MSLQVNIYFFFNGNCEEAMNFYKDALDGNIESVMRYGDAPTQASEDYKNKVMHGVLNAQGAQIFFSDSGEQRNVTFGDNFSVSLNFKSDGEINRTFEALSGNGGTITLPLQDTFWGARFGMCTDKYGVNWMFNFDKPKD